jgi:DNA-binding transcriptional regulator YiaG
MMSLTTATISRKFWIPMTRHEQWLLDHKDYPHDWCLIWPFARESRVGRGMMAVSGSKKVWAHRAMCELVHGPAPTDKPQAAHSCGNGDQGCVNPRHLSWASNSENQLQRYRMHDRGPSNTTGSKSRFTPTQIAEIRAKYGEFTQTKLAEMYGCSLGTIQYYLKYREERGHAGGKVIHWSPEEDEKIKRAIGWGYNFRQVAEYVGRSMSATTARAYRLGLKSGQAPTRKDYAHSNGER